MGIRRLAFPIALAIAWVIMAALAIVDFAAFSATTSAPQGAQVEKPLPPVQPGQG